MSACMDCGQDVRPIIASVNGGRWSLVFIDPDNTRHDCAVSE